MITKSSGYALWVALLLVTGLVVMILVAWRAASHP